MSFLGGSTGGPESPAKNRAGDGDRTHDIQLGNLPSRQIAGPLPADLKTPDNETQLTFDDLLSSSSAVTGPAHESASESRGIVEGERLKEEGIARAIRSAGPKLLDVAREECRKIALTRVSREVTADDAHYALIRLGYEPSILGNAAGGLFKNQPDWAPVMLHVEGEEPFQKKKTSTRSVGRGNQIGVWRYVG